MLSMSSSMHADCNGGSSQIVSCDKQPSRLNLLDMPLDILRQIAEHLALVHRIESEEEHPRTRVYRSLKGLSTLPAHIFSCQKWADIALPLHQIDYDRLYLSGNSLRSIPPYESQIYKKLCTKLTKLSIRLQGTPSNRTAPHPFFCDSDGSDDEDSDVAGAKCNPVDEAEKALGMSPNSSERGKDPLKEWNRDMADHIKSLAHFVADCELLDEVTFEALRGGRHKDPDPDWDYLNQPSMEKLVLCLPSNLKYLTLDLAGADLMSGEDSEPAHICPAVTRCLLNAEHVRLRLRHICPAVFGVQSVQAHDNWQSLHFKMRPDSGIDGHSRLRSLTLRLSLPMFLTSNQTSTYDSRVCPDFATGRGMHISKLMPLAARHLYSLEAGIRTLKVTYRDPNPEGIELLAHDCIDWVRRTLPEEVFCYEDEGDQWMPWEDTEDMHMVTMPLLDPISMAQEMIREAASG